MFANKGKMKDGKGTPEREPALAVASNPFAALNADPGESSTPVSGSGLTRKPSVPEMAPSGRPRLQLAPRTLPLPGQAEEGDSKAKSGEEVSSVKKEEDEGEGEVDVTDEVAKRLVKTRLDEFFNVKSIEEGVESFEGLPVVRHYMLIRNLIEKAMEMKNAEVELTAGLFGKLVEKEKVSKAVFRKAFEPVVEMLDDTAVE